MRTLLSLFAATTIQSSSTSSFLSSSSLRSTFISSSSSSSCSALLLLQSSTSSVKRHTPSRVTRTCTSKMNMMSTSTNSDFDNTSSSPNGGTRDSGSASYQLVVDPFCFRQFAEHEASKTYGGTVFSNSVQEFEQIVNSRYVDETQLKDGYAPFCKHLFILNDFTDAQVNVLPITVDNESLLRTKYEARNDKELPVLTRFFPKELITTELPIAKYLDLILYSREQINKENAAMNKGKQYTPQQQQSPWGIVSIKAQHVDYEIPMTPITAMRNALGKEQGGSGVPLNREAYMQAFHFWNTHATVS